MAIMVPRRRGVLSVAEFLQRACGLAVSCCVAVRLALSLDGAGSPAYVPQSAESNERAGLLEVLDETAGGDRSGAGESLSAEDVDVRHGASVIAYPHNKFVDVGYAQYGESPPRSSRGLPDSGEEASSQRGCANDTTILAEIMRGYNKQKVPGGRVKVTVEVWVQEVTTISDLTSDFKLDIYISELWLDEALNYEGLDPCKKNLSLNNDVLEKLWTPNSCFVNSKSAEIHSSPFKNIFLMIYPNGTIWTNYRLKLTGPCNMDLTTFPFDMVECELVFESFNYNTDEVQMEWSTAGVIKLREKIELADYALVDIEVSRIEEPFPAGMWHELKQVYIFRRRFGWYILQAYLPTFLTIFISWISFCLGTKSIPARTMLGVNSLLAMSFQFGNIIRNLPRVSYVKAIDVWMLSCMTFVFASLIELATIGYLSRDSGPTPPPQQQQPQQQLPEQQNAPTFVVPFTPQPCKLQDVQVDFTNPKINDNKSAVYAENLQLSDARRRRGGGEVITQFSTNGGGQASHRSRSAGPPPVANSSPPTAYHAYPQQLQQQQQPPPPPPPSNMHSARSNASAGMRCGAPAPHTMNPAAYSMAACVPQQSMPAFTQTWAGRGNDYGYRPPGLGVTPPSYTTKPYGAQEVMQTHMMGNDVHATMHQNVQQQQHVDQCSCMHQGYSCVPTHVVHMVTEDGRHVVCTGVPHTGGQLMADAHRAPDTLNRPAPLALQHNTVAPLPTAVSRSTPAANAQSTWCPIVCRLLCMCNTVPPAKAPQQCDQSFKDELALRIDKLSSIFFPTMFVVFNIFYWTYYIMTSPQNQPREKEVH